MAPNHSGSRLDFQSHPSPTHESIASARPMLSFPLYDELRSVPGDASSFNDAVIALNSAVGPEAQSIREVVYALIVHDEKTLLARTGGLPSGAVVGPGGIEISVEKIRPLLQRIIVALVYG
jgi:hypothetical protein